MKEKEEFITVNCIVCKKDNLFKATINKIIEQFPIKCNHCEVDMTKEIREYFNKKKTS